MKFEQGQIIEINPTGIHEYGYIYALLDPKTNIPFYVGKSVDPYLRLISHRTYKKRYKTKTDKIRMKILEVITINPKERIDYDKLSKREYHWIQKLKEDGYKLENKTHHLPYYPKNNLPYDTLPVPSNIIKRREMMDKMFGPLSNWVPKKE